MRGAWAEDLAVTHLESHGLEVLARNYRIRGGEIDIVMRDQSVIVFVEVKQRSSTAFGGALEAVTVPKMNLLRRAALHYLVNELHSDDLPCRFDLLLVHGDARSNRLEWLQNAF
jgi:putative endonuclease